MDFGYDIQDFFTVDPIFGTNEDLEEMFAKAKELGIKIIMDFVPNHTSDKHQWFLDSIDRVGEYTDYCEYQRLFYKNRNFIEIYLFSTDTWHSGKPNNGSRPLPPNNWVSSLFILLFYF